MLLYKAGVARVGDAPAGITSLRDVSVGGGGGSPAS